MKTAVTGGSGFLGSTIAKVLLNQGHDVTIIDRAPLGTKGLTVDAPLIQGDIRDSALLADAFQGVEEVYHLAGVLGTSELQESLSDAIDINIWGTVNVFEQAISAGARRVFYPGKPNVWLNTYTITKAAAEQFGRMLNEGNSETRILALRYYNAYGPGQALLPIRKIIPAFAIQSMLGRPIEIWGDGEQVVDMIYSEDLAKISVAFARAERTDVIPDCGSGVRISVNEVAEAVNAHFGNTSGLKHLPMRPGEVPHTILTADTSEMHSVLGDVQLSSWESSLVETLDWYSALSRTAIDKAAAFYGWIQ